MSVEVQDLPLHVQRDQFDPPAGINALRDKPGLERVTDSLGRAAWLVTRYDEAREVFSDATRFSNSRVPSVGCPACRTRRGPRRPAAGLDPPEHTRLRRMLTPEFTVRRMRRLEPRISEIIDAALDDVERAGKPADLVPTFALPVPSLVICELLGVPYADREAFQYRTGRQLDISLPVQERMKLGLESRAYMTGLVQRAMADPGEDMIGMLVREHGDDLSLDELVGIGSLLLVAGHETTANMLGLGTLALLQHPDQLAKVRDDPAAIEPAVEELMRFLSIVHCGNPAHDEGRRGARRATHIPAGALLVLALATANRDPALHRRRRPLRRRRGARSGTSRSGTACTTASARRWPGWRWPPRSRRCSGGSPRSRPPPTPPAPTSARAHSSTGCGACPSPGDAQGRRGVRSALDGRASGGMSARPAP